ncbi:hypothetical protein FQA47_012918 [Oryzias melastigma]|uniref:Uncharacterized protein n=1 Tax=Oryzias melastigma TaxID=30732 RepID=A0A834FFD6_ORYME|nr:hypothetical protein FQA47_012918 [Oryzias melastigma]
MNSRACSRGAGSRVPASEYRLEPEKSCHSRQQMQSEDKDAPAPPASHTGAAPLLTDPPPRSRSIPAHLLLFPARSQDSGMTAR